MESGNKSIFLNIFERTTTTILNAVSLICKSFNMEFASFAEVLFRRRIYGARGNDVTQNENTKSKKILLFACLLPFSIK